MIVLDSSCWIEIFAKSSFYTHFVKLLSDPNELVVPTIILTEVFKKLLLDRSEKEALYIIRQMDQCISVE
jgi:toxin FitB